MELEKAIKIIKDIDTSDDYELQEAYNTVFQELDRLQEENKRYQPPIYFGGIKRGGKTYEVGVVVGTKREREYWENKIREKIEEINKEINSSIDNSKGGLDEEFIDKGTELLAQKRVLQDLLKEE